MFKKLPSIYPSTSLSAVHDKNLSNQAELATTDAWIHRREIPYILNKSDLCSESSQVLVMIIVISAPQNYRQRSIIRRTWAKESSTMGVKVAFLIGQSPKEDGQRAILEEDLMHKDIIQANFIDAYYNLTIKSVTMVRWVTSFCSKAKFLLKIDDDVLLNVWNLAIVIVKLKGLKRTLWGNLAVNYSVQRVKSSKYYVPHTMYPNSRFPSFLNGPAYLMSGDSPRILANGSKSVPYLPLEDVFLTGIVADSAGLRKVHHRGFPNY
ncbi:unnamed protein product, partial [Ixodes hexagonus]